MHPSRSALPPSSSLLTTKISTLTLCVLIFSSLVGPMAQAQSGPPVLITQNVDESKLVTLAGNTRPEANKQNDRGLVPDSLSMEHMLLQLRRSPQQEGQLLQFIEELQSPSSPNFHHWLTAKQYGERFGLVTQDLNVLTHWLESYGFKVNVIYANGLLIDFSGTAGQVRAAFHTEIHQLDVKGVKHIANMSDPQIPAALAPAVVGVVSLHDFKPHTNYKPRSNYTIGGGGYLVVPGDLATIYNLNPLFSAGISGQGQTIVVVEDTDVFTTADWTTFRSTFGLSSFTGGSFTQVHPAPPSGPNNCTDPGVNPDDGEAIIDAEYASAAAPSAAIELISCSDTETTFGGFIAIQNLLNESATPPAIMSMSYGECEAFNGATSNTAFGSAFQQAVTEGVSVFVSAGDSGAAGCSVDVNPVESSDTFGIGVSGWASSPYNVAVGGTDFGDTFAGTNSTYWSATNSPTYESALSYVPEIPWDDSCASLLGAVYEGFTQTYGTSGFCNASGVTDQNFLNTAAGSGGPSGCATGSASTQGVVSGSCAGWAKPSYQSVFGNPSDTVRDLPDVSLFAGNGIWGHYYVFCYSDVANGGTACTGAPDNWAGAGGTSFSSPIMAGIQALVNQKTGARQGNPNVVYYSLAAAEFGASGDNAYNSTLGNTASSSCIFYDVTLGDMDVNCLGTVNCYLPSGTNGVLSTSDSANEPTGNMVDGVTDGGAYVSTTGWDFATGIGTVNAANLVNNWPNSLPSTTTTLTSSAPTGANQGTTVTFTATVATTGSNPPTGNVTFYNGAVDLGSSTLSGSLTATLATSALPVGSDSITAVYGGDSNNASSTSSVLNQVITGTFSLSTPTPPPAVLSGGFTTSTFTVTPTGTGVTTFGANVSFTVSGCPANATCTLSTNPILAGAGTTTETLTIQTTGPNPDSQGGIRRRRADNRPDNRSPWLPLSLPLAGIVMAGFAGRKVWKHSAVASLCVSLILLGLLVACGGSSTAPPIAVTVGPQATTLFPNYAPDAWPNQTQTFTASVTNTTNTAVTWNVTTTNGGTITSAGVYTAPTIAVNLPTTATVTATSQADSTKVGMAVVNITPSTVPTAVVGSPYSITVTATEGATQNTTSAISLTVN